MTGLLLMLLGDILVGVGILWALRRRASRWRKTVLTPRTRFTPALPAVWQHKACRVLMTCSPGTALILVEMRTERVIAEIDSLSPRIFGSFPRVENEHRHQVHR